MINTDKYLIIILYPKYFNCLYSDKKFAQRFHLINHEARIHAVNIPAQDHRSESDEEFSWDSKDQKNNSNSNLESQSAPMEDEVQDVTEIEVDSPEICRQGRVIAMCRRCGPAHCQVRSLSSGEDLLGEASFQLGREGYDRRQEDIAGRDQLAAGRS